MSFCGRCNNYTLSSKCSCVKFEVIHEDYCDPSDPFVIWAIDEENAAENYAKYYNEGRCNYTMTEPGGEIIVEINGERYMVEAEPSITYSVIKI